jgi:predicted nuclease with TOPRIM domain
MDLNNQKMKKRKLSNSELRLVAIKSFTDATQKANEFIEQEFQKINKKDLKKLEEYEAEKEPLEKKVEAIEKKITELRKKIADRSSNLCTGRYHYSTPSPRKLSFDINSRWDREKVSGLVIELSLNQLEGTDDISKLIEKTTKKIIDGFLNTYKNE